MKYIYKMESVIVTITAVLCTILLLKLINKLRLLVSWRVNCWFCNNNFWVKYPDRNSWTCPKCEQYNGFTKDGDYNKQLTTANDQIMKTPKVFQKSPPKNGLCKMCNINQQLKVTQLANFVPMNENKYDEEIEGYRLQLEKAYKLCSPCKKVVQIKLHKEKETLLGSKLLEKRTPEKKNHKKDKQTQILKSFINSTSMLIAFILFILVSFEFYKNITKYENLHSTITNIKEILTGLLERICSIVKMKTLQTFPILETYDIDNITHLHSNLPNMFNFEHKQFDSINTMIQKALGGFVCLIQIVGNVWNVNSLKYTVAFDLLWSVFVIMSIADKTVAVDPLIISCFKVGTFTLLYFIVDL
ncbi:hypothetical protein O3G_MSEX006081 [Manduca sexta]|uniref:Ima1 N-terminal domain-containing protein n=1 Tax=Manduca sexta TaxID=7130 RepID=A0A922CKI1_MANSE|nr:hypothetical protein O3G_MSEX006081 [Manduca sexta]